MRSLVPSPLCVMLVGLTLTDCNVHIKLYIYMLCRERESWLREYGLVTSDDMHPDFRELHLSFGYRPIPSSFLFCLKRLDWCWLT